MSVTTDLERLASLTSRYARYSRSAGGLSSVIGGVLCLAAFAAGAWLPIRPGLQAALAAAPFLWLVSKDALRRLYYQRAGAVAERSAVGHRRWHAAMTVYLALFAILVVGGVAYAAGSASLPWPVLGFLAMVAAVPLVAWRWFWSIGDFLVGVLLFCQAAAALIGRPYAAHWIPIALSFSVIAMASGWREHRDYLDLRRELDGSFRRA
jgi:hypothetical protein